jgi:hypothetical protein
MDGKEKPPVITAVIYFQAKLPKLYHCSTTKDLEDVLTLYKAFCLNKNEVVKMEMSGTIKA